MGAILYGEVQEYDKEEYKEEWLGDIVESLHITYNKKDMTDVEK